MQFRTLTDFRAEFGIRLGELAEKLGIPYNELEQIENSGVVPADIAEKIIACYELGNTYFTENIGAPPKPPVIKSTPKNPFAYFCKVFIVYSIIEGLISTFPSSIMTTIGAFVSSQTYDSVMRITLRILFAAVSIFGYLLLSKYIIKHTTFEGNIYKYKYISCILPTAIYMPVRLAFGTIVNHLGENADTFLLFALADLAVAIPGLIFTILIYALINNIAIKPDSEKQNKTMNIVCICTVISQIIYIAYAFAVDPFSSLLSVASYVIYPCIYALIAAGIMLKNKISPKLDTVWYTILPIVTFVLPIVFMTISSVTQ